MSSHNTAIDVSVVLPCRNEEESLKESIETIKRVFVKNNIAGEIIVSDSSSDASPHIARQLSVILIKHDEAGYGKAYHRGFSHVRGKYIFCADPDGTYDFQEIPRFMNALQRGSDLVIGNRFKGRIERNAMPFLHRYIGNPFQSFLLRVFFRTPIGDVHSGMRALKKDTLPRLNLQTTGMEFASEIIVKAVKNGLTITELPINYYKRKGTSKLRTLTDGWRHLRFLLLWSPLYLFFLPGFLFLSVGAVSMFFMYFYNPVFFGIPLILHPLFFSALGIVVGYQLVFFGFFSKTYAITHLGDTDTWMNTIHRYITIEKGSAFGAAVALTGVVIFITIVRTWLQSGFGELNEIKNSIVALTFVIIGVQTIFSSFMLSILGIKHKTWPYIP